MARKVYYPGKAIHTVSEHTGRTLCNRSVIGLSFLSDNGWTRIGQEAASNGPCMRCLNVEISSR